jgi:hypothetical protein
MRGGAEPIEPATLETIKAYLSSDDGVNVLTELGMEVVDTYSENFESKFLSKYDSLTPGSKLRLKIKGYPKST